MLIGAGAWFGHRKEDPAGQDPAHPTPRGNRNTLPRTLVTHTSTDLAKRVLSLFLFLFSFILGGITAIQNGWLYLIPVVVIYVGAQWISNQIVRPVVFSRFMDLHPIVIFLFLFIAAEYIGIVGVIFAPALAALTAVLFEELYLKKLD